MYFSRTLPQDFPQPVLVRKRTGTPSSDAAPVVGSVRDDMILCLRSRRPAGCLGIPSRLAWCANIACSLKRTSAAGLPFPRPALFFPRRQEETARWSIPAVSAHLGLYRLRRTGSIPCQYCRSIWLGYVTYRHGRQPCVGEANEITSTGAIVSSGPTHEPRRPLRSWVPFCPAAPRLCQPWHQPRRQRSGR
jgi:hypothetical protein